MSRIHLIPAIVSLALISSAYGVYALVAVPLIEPSAERRANPEIDDEEYRLASEKMHERQRERLAKVFPPGSWELNGSKVLESDQGMMLLQDYQPLPDGRMQIKPFTMVLYDTARPEPGKIPRAIIMQAPEGAVVEFDAPLDLARGKVGRIEGGLLSGDIRIHAAESRPGAKDAIEIVTRNVQMNKTAISTPHNVDFRIGASYGSGRDLMIRLASLQDGDMRNGKGLGISGIRSLELVHVERVHLEMPGEGIFPGAKPIGHQPAAESLSAAPAPTIAAPARPMPPVEITCQGPFHFDFMEYVARFEDRVDVMRLNAEGPSDQLSCQLLEVYFRPKTKDEIKKDDRAAIAQKLLDDAQSIPGEAGEKATAPTKPAPREIAGSEKKNAAKKNRSGAIPPLAIAKVVAVGKPVIVRAPSVGAVARGQRLEYDFTTRRISLEGQTPVQLRQGFNEVEAPAIQYELAEGGQIGRLWAAGPGRFSGAMDKAGKQQFEAVWQTEIRLRPHNGSQVLSLIEGTKVSFTDQGWIAADQLHLWLQEVPRLPFQPKVIQGAQKEQMEGLVEAEAIASRSPIQAANWLQDNPPLTPVPNSDTASSAPGAAKKPDRDLFSSSSTLRPDRLMAIGNVRIDAPQLTAATPRLEIWFTERPAKADDPRAAVADVRPFNQRDRAPREGDPRDGTKKPPMQRFDVTGDLVQVQMVRNGVKTELADLTIDGRVKLTETRTPKPGELPLIVTGKLVRLVAADMPNATLSVIGQPASVEGRGMTMLGGSIQMQRDANRLWIDGPGQMKLPLPRNSREELARSDKPASASLPVGSAPLESMTVNWQGGMNFDGRTAHFEKQIEGLTAQQIVRSQTLDVTLNRAVDFSQPQKADDIAVRQIAFDGGFNLESRTVEEGKIVGIEKIQARNMTIDHITGAIHADGPGWIHSVRKSTAGEKSGRSSGGLFPTMGAPRAASPAATDTTAPPATASSAPAARGSAISVKRDPKKPLNYLYVTFQQGIDGNLHKREISFHDQIRAIYGPIAKWEDKIDVTQPESLGEQGVILTCDKLTILQMPARTPEGRDTMELEAFGNTVVEGKTFTARAERIAYAEAKDLLVLEGGGRGDAELFRQTYVGGPSSRAAARKILFWRTSNQLEVDDARFLDLNNLGNMKMPEKPKQPLPR